MPPTRYGERDRNDFRKSRSYSPPYHKKKRSWLESSSSSSHYDHSHHRSPPAKKKDFKPPPSKPLNQSSSSYSRRSRSRSRSPKYSKRDEGYSRKDSLNKHRSPVRGEKDRYGSRQDSRQDSRPRKRSLSPIRSSKDRYNSYSDRDKGRDDRKQKNSSRSPDSNRDHDSASTKKKQRQSSPSVPVQKKQNQGRSPSPYTKQKPSLATLHNRFTDSDEEPFHLQIKDNVTIAILRNPRAEPSDDVTIKKIFDSSLFKMVHKKSEGRKPIFDREEIKVWRHDENLEDDPDFEERRLVRVKDTTKKKAADSSSLRMSPDLLRKSLGVNNRSKSGSPHGQRSPNVRINPQPDSRYESRYQQHIKRDESNAARKRKDGVGGGDSGRRVRGEEDGGGRFKGEEKRDGRRGEDYDLREALDRRKSGKDEDFERGREFSDPRDKHSYHDNRNVVVDQDRSRRFDDGVDGRGRGRGFHTERRGWGRGRGPRRQWSPRRTNQDDRDEYNSRDRGFDRRNRYSISPSNTRGRGGSSFRGRHFGRDTSQYEYEEEEDLNSPPGDDYNKYSQHDDRDVSPSGFRGGRGRGWRGRGGGRFQSSRGFRGMRGRFFGSGATRGHGFRTRGSGSYFGRGNSRSMERDDRRTVEHGSDREWKHDMYDTVQSDDEMPHSTTVNN